MIYTFTPNPCLDLGGTVDNLVPDEKSYVHDEIRSPGGNAINAARIIQRLGIPVVATGFLGGGTGLEVQNLLNQEQVQHDFIKIKAQTRINVTVSNQRDHHQTRLSFPGPRILPSERQILNKYISKIELSSLLIIGGSLPPGFTEVHLSHVLRIAKNYKIPTIVDVPGHILGSAFKTPTLLIKPNLLEFQALTGKKVSGLKEVEKLAKKLTEKIPFICVSSVEGGALLVTPQSSWFGRIPKLKIKTTVGAGDSMVGAMGAHIWKESKRTRQSIHQLAKNATQEFTETLLRHGLAAACGTLSLPGVLLATEKQIKFYLPRIMLQRIN